MPGELLPDSTHTERFSPLHQAHVDAGASFTDFAGWQMPVRYSSDLAEHHAVRTAAALFDLSHMAEIIVEGPGAAAALDFALAGKLSAIAIGQAKYSLVLAPDGGIVDDVVVYRTHENRFVVVANAGNRFEAATAVTERAARFDTTVVDASDEIALIAVQGPESVAILARLASLEPGSLEPGSLEPGSLELETAPGDLKYYWSTNGTFHGEQVFVGRTGYTGEDGFELYLPAALAATLWNELLSAGAEFALVPAGLASRDTLRLEAGMPLYGHELSRDVVPAQAGLGRVVNLTKPGDFVGCAAVEGPMPNAARMLVGLKSDGKRAGRAGYELFADETSETPIGTITSGALSPTLGFAIAMAFVDASWTEPGSHLFIDVRGSRIAAVVVQRPFYTRESK